MSCFRSSRYCNVLENSFCVLIKKPILLFQIRISFYLGISSEFRVFRDAEKKCEINRNDCS